jgi:hypothetical protein
LDPFCDSSTISLVPSPNAEKKLGAKEYIDFYLSEPYFWDFEFLRGENKLRAHTDRFRYGEAYSFINPTANLLHPTAKAL